MTKSNNTQLLSRFVASFEKLGDLTTYYELDPNAWALSFGDLDEYEMKQWRPVLCATARSALDDLYSKIPQRFPPLYEELLLTYRWAEVDLEMYRLLANPAGTDLKGIQLEIFRDKCLWKELIPQGYIQFGKGPDVNYDPVCFDTRRRQKDDDCRVVQLDHEAILCDRRIREVAELAPSFRDLVIGTIEVASRTGA